MKIYIVTSGSYSDYSINAVFTDKAKADSFCALDSEYSIEEWDSDVYDTATLPPGKKPYRVYMRQNGDTYIAETTTFLDYWQWSKSITFFGARTPYVEIENIAKNNQENEYMLRLHCLAKDKYHAVKITNEHRIMLLANNWWPAYDSSKPTIHTAEPGRRIKDSDLEKSC